MKTIASLKIGERGIIVGFTDEVLYQSYYAQGIGLIKYVQDYQAVAGVEDTDNLRNYMVY